MTQRDRIHRLEQAERDLERVEDERDALRVSWADASQEAEQWKAAHDEVAYREQALAAHVELAKGIMNRLIDTPHYRHGPRPPAVQEYLDWVAEAPATSLAHLKAEAIRTAADELCDNIGGDIGYGDLMAYAENLCHQ